MSTPSLHSFDCPFEEIFDNILYIFSMLIESPAPLTLTILIFQCMNNRPNTFYKNCNFQSEHAEPLLSWLAYNDLHKL